MWHDVTAQLTIFSNPDNVDDNNRRNSSDSHSIDTSGSLSPSLATGNACSLSAHRIHLSIM